MSSAAALHKPQSQTFRGRGAFTVLTKYKRAMVAKRTSNAYARASCEYQINMGLVATSRAAKSAARRDQSSRAINAVTGTVAVPASADNDRMPASLRPNTAAHILTSTKNRCGVSSVFVTLAMSCENGR